MEFILIAICESVVCCLSHLNDLRLCDLAVHILIMYCVDPKCSIFLPKMFAHQFPMFAHFLTSARHNYIRKQNTIQGLSLVIEPISLLNPWNSMRALIDKITSQEVYFGNHNLKTRQVENQKDYYLVLSSNFFKQINCDGNLFHSFLI